MPSQKCDIYVWKIFFVFSIYCCSTYVHIWMYGYNIKILHNHYYMLTVLYKWWENLKINFIIIFCFKIREKHIWYCNVIWEDLQTIPKSIQKYFKNILLNLNHEVGLFHRYDKIKWVRYTAYVFTKLHPSKKNKGCFMFWLCWYFRRYWLKVGTGFSG